MRFLKYLVLYLVVSLVSVTAQERIGGRVVNGTQDSSAVSNTTVHLQKMTANASMPEEVTDTQTNRTGQFEFTLDAVDEQATYFVATNFEGIRYFSAGIPGDSGTATDVQLVVYDSTRSTAGVDAFMHHIIIEDIGDALRFRETRVLNNPGTQTLTTAFVDDQVGEGLFRFHLPPQAVNFSPISARVGHELVKEGHHVIDRGIMLPGNKTVSFGYDIPMHENTLSLTLSATHDTRTFDLFVSSANVKISSPILEDQGPFNIRGNEYHRYGATEVAAGTDIPVTLRRTGAAPTEQSPVLVLTLTALLLILGLSVGLARRERGAPQPETATTEQLDTMKRNLVHKIAKLDVSKNGDSQTSSQRQALMQELQQIELQRQRAVKKSRKKK